MPGCLRALFGKRQGHAFSLNIDLADLVFLDFKAFKIFAQTRVNDAGNSIRAID